MCTVEFVPSFVDLSAYFTSTFDIYIYIYIEISNSNPGKFHSLHVSLSRVCLQETTCTVLGHPSLAKSAAPLPIHRPRCHEQERTLLRKVAQFALMPDEGTGTLSTSTSSGRGQHRPPHRPRKHTEGSRGWSSGAKFNPFSAFDSKGWRKQCV